MASVSLTKHISPPQQTSSMGARRGRGICGDRSSNGSVQWRTSVRSRLERQLRASWVGDETTRAAAESACEGNNAAASSSSSSTARMGGREFVAADGAEREREIHLHHHHRHHHRPRDVGRGLYRFTRPHTMIGTAVSITSVSLIATLHTHTPMSIALSRWLHATVTALLANVAIVGYNQLCDISIDAVNKPYLPLVNGDIDTRTGRLIVLATGAAAIALSSISHCMWLRIAVLGSLGLGWLYSSPLVRLKRSPVLAALSILVVRAIIVQLCFYQHIIGAEGAQVAIMPPALIVSTVFMTAFSIAIAVGKDMPDVKGDADAGIRTASIRMGVPTVFHGVVALLTAAYAGCGAVSCLLASTWWRAALVATAHVAAVIALWSRSSNTNLNLQESISGFYQFLWRLFYASYIVLPFVG